MSAIVDRIVDKIDDMSDPAACWVWTASRDSKGYGRVGYHGRNTLAHRTVFKLAVEAIPDGMHIDHLCRNTSCVNPDHLEVVTPEEHALRRPLATHCHRGHPYDDANTYMWNGSTRSCRYCRACQRINDAKRVPRRKEK